MRIWYARNANCTKRLLCLLLRDCYCLLLHFPLLSHNSSVLNQKLRYVLRHHRLSGVGRTNSSMAVPRRSLVDGLTGAAIASSGTGIAKTAFDRRSLFYICYRQCLFSMHSSQASAGSIPPDSLSSPLAISGISHQIFI